MKKNELVTLAAEQTGLSKKDTEKKIRESDCMSTKTAVLPNLYSLENIG